MRIDIISAIPQLLEGPFQHSILKRAHERQLLTIHVHDLREYGHGKHQQIDDYQYGGGAGMVMMPEPIANCIDDLKKERTYDDVIYMTPDGETLNQQKANSLSLATNLLILCGHYKGIDERIRKHYITREISISDVVLSGGELAAAILVDAVGRLIPGVLNDETSALFDSFQDGLLAPPVYTRPAEFQGERIPDILRSGNTPKVEEWRYEKALEKTKHRRPDLLNEDEEK
jgi:tRNA (guanine37-N1)-methyltransferase